MVLLRVAPAASCEGGSWRRRQSSYKAYKFQIVGPADERCEQCGNGDSVYLIRDPFRGVASHALHERCASVFYKREEDGS